VFLTSFILPRELIPLFVFAYTIVDVDRISIIFFYEIVGDTAYSRFLKKYLVALMNKMILLEMTVTVIQLSEALSKSYNTKSSSE
jgi:hypothetical protein